MKNLKTFAIGIFLVLGTIAIATQVYHINITPLPANGSDVAP